MVAINAVHGHAGLPFWGVKTARCRWKTSWLQESFQGAWLQRGKGQSNMVNRGQSHNYFWGHFIAFFVFTLTSLVPVKYGERATCYNQCSMQGVETRFQDGGPSIGDALIKEVPPFIGSQH